MTNMEVSQKAVKGGTLNSCYVKRIRFKTEVCNKYNKESK